MIKTLLVANRGEIACRIMKTATRLGIKTVAVYSFADSNALHVKMADETFYLGPSSPQSSYLNIDRIIEAAKQTGADAIHPGYGFLSENAGFAKACVDNDLIFIGPSSQAIASMADKKTAKELMRDAEVPVVPGFYSDDRNTDLWRKEAQKISLPVLIKAVSGGGGRGMRLVTNINDFDDAFIAASREAKTYFNDDRVFLEKYIADPRHIEIQIFADQNGHCVYLFERDCSIQRRHQKIIEEAPAPNFSEALRKKMGDAAVAAAKAINYVGAGTVEFLLDGNGKFYFMEMNTRLQVEHPVTEMITGLDLVEWQLNVAIGTPLPWQQDDLHIQGHAIECRLYAEDPENNFLPSVGRIEHFHMSEKARVDSGYVAGDAVSIHYDAMLAKLIVHADNRESAANDMVAALAATEIIGVKTNTNLLQGIFADQEFKDGLLSTHFLQGKDYPRTTPNETELACAAFALLCAQKQKNKAYHEHTMDVFSPWQLEDHWRANSHAPMTITLWHGDQKYDIAMDDYTINGILTNHDLNCELNQKTYHARVVLWKNELHLYLNGSHFQFHVGHSSEQDKKASEVAGHLTAPMPGTVAEVFVENGIAVKKDDRLLIIEAMKMEHAIVATHDGVVDLKVALGQLVSEGQELIVIG